MLALFTEQEDVVIDLFAGTDNMARECIRRNRHCLSVEIDKAMHISFLDEIEANSTVCYKFFHIHRLCLLGIWVHMIIFWMF